MMPTMASAYAVVRSDQVPEATSVLNTLQRVGGSMGTALLAVVLSDHARATLGSGAASSGGLIQTLSPTVRAHVRRATRQRLRKHVLVGRSARR